MNRISAHPPIALLCLGYFLAYIPYSALTRALSLGLLPGFDEPVPGFVLLPTVAIATSVALLIYIKVAGGFQYLQISRLFGLPIPLVRYSTLCSGIATAVIIATTTLNYTFTGISILLALLLMRAGVLALAPLVDVTFGRPIQHRSWFALGLSVLAIAVAFSDVNNYNITLGAAISIAAYLIGYVIRLNIITHVAKSPDRTSNLRYVFEETLVAAAALTMVPVLVACCGTGEIASHLRYGFSDFFLERGAFPAIAIGLSYAVLFVFGTSIYLDHRENTFCIPLNRCSSLLSGLVSTYILMLCIRLKGPSGAQLVGAALVGVALVCLLPIPLFSRRFFYRVPVERFFLFVCSGNTSRSPIAQALCNDFVARQLSLVAGQHIGTAPRAESAGLTAQPGRPLAPHAAEALRRIGITPHVHASRDVTAELVRQATTIFCMTEEQCRTLAARYPEAAVKISRFDPESDIEDPSGKDAATFDRVTARLQWLIKQRLQPLAI